VAGLDDFQALYEEVLAHGFGSTRYLQYAKDKVNEGQSELSKRLRLRVWNEDTNLSATIANGGQLIPPSNMIALEHIWDNTANNAQRPLLPLSSVTMERFDRTRRGRPEFYTFQQEFINLTPLPDATYTIGVRFWRTPNLLANNADVPEAPEDLREAIVSWAVSKCYRREQDFSAAQAFMADFEKAVAQGAFRQHDDAGDTPDQVAGMW
jgi:hypothetical protein